MRGMNIIINYYDNIIVTKKPSDTLDSTMMFNLKVCYFYDRIACVSNKYNKQYITLFRSIGSK